mgnify:CR=1 FL=1
MSLNAKTVSLVYVLIASIYIIASDLVTSYWYVDQSASITVQTVKGLLFVMVTGIILYQLLRRYAGQIGVHQKQLEKAHKEIDEHRQLFGAIINQTQAVIYVKDADGSLRLVNDAFLELFGVERNQVMGRTAAEILGKSLPDNIRENDRLALESDRPVTAEEEIPVNGEVKHFYSIKYPLKGVPNYEDCICGISTDITEQKKLMSQLEERVKEQSCLYKIANLSEKEYTVDELLNKAVKYLPEGWQYPEITEARIEFDGTSYSTDGYTGGVDKLTETDTFIEGLPLTITIAYTEERPTTGSTPFLDEEEDLIKAIADTLTTKLDRFLTFQKLQSSLEEKNVLLQEIHHRVKNNLAVISGLLQIQRFKVDNKYYQELLESSEMRLHSMGLIHDKLYKSDSLSTINFKSYVEDLVDTIKQTVVAQTELNWIIEADPVDININQAVPCALMLNELITNAGKHAFTGEEGTIRISVQKTGNEIAMSVEDDGEGLPESFSLKEAESMGFTIIKTLAKQLSASIDLDSDDKGTKVTCRFQKQSIRGSSSNIDEVY